MSFDSLEVQPTNAGECPTTLLGQRHDTPPTIIVARISLGEPLTDEAIDETRGAAATETTSRCDLRRSQPVSASLVEHEQDLVLLERNAERLLHLRSEFVVDTGEGDQEAAPDLTGFG